MLEIMLAALDGTFGNCNAPVLRAVVRTRGRNLGTAIDLMVIAEVFVDVACGNLTSGNCHNDGLRTPLAVSADKNVLEAVCTQELICNEMSALGFHAELLKRSALDILADCDEHDISIDAHLRFVRGNRSRTSTLYSADALRLADECANGAFFVCLDSHRRLQNDHLDAFCQCGMNFLFKCRHVFEPAAIRHDNFLGASTHARTCAVHGNVATADHNHIFAGEIGKLVIAGLFKQFDSTHDARQIDAVDPEALASLRTNGDVNGIVFLRNALHLGVINVMLVLDLDATHAQNGADVLVQALAREAVRRDAVTHHATKLLAAFEHRDVVTHESAEIRAGHAGRTTADDSHALAS